MAFSQRTEEPEEYESDWKGELVRGVFGAIILGLAVVGAQSLTTPDQAQTHRAIQELNDKIDWVHKDLTSRFKEAEGHRLQGRGQATVERIRIYNILVKQ